MSKSGQYRVDDRPDPYSVDNGSDPIAAQPHHTKNPKKKIWLRVTILVVILLILSAGLIYFLGHKSPKPKGQTAAQKGLQVTAPNTKATTTNYISNGTDLNLNFAYPNNWTVVPPSNDNKNDQTIALTSPLTTVINADNVSVVGKVVVQVRPGTDTIDELNSNSPATALASIQIAYSSPTANQISYPYISYIHFSDGSKTSGAFEEIIITGGLSFAQGQSISAEYLSGLDPIISASFYQCSTKSCSGSSQSLMSITSNTWQNAPIFQQVLAIFESFQLN